MPEAPAFLPALTLQAQMQGLAALGLDMALVRERVGPLPESPDALVPRQQYLEMWSQAQALFGQPGLPSALAMAIPFGAFGLLDYLVGSADTVGGCCESAVLHFSMVAKDTRPEIEPVDDGAHIVRVRGDATLPPMALEFTMALFVGRLRHVTAGRFKPTCIGLPVPRPAEDALRPRLLDAAIRYGFPCAEMQVDAQQWQLRNGNADPLLNATLKRIADQLNLVEPGGTPLEQALRPRLRAALAQGRADLARVASLLGVSERTLQRRLADEDRSFSDLVERFRREEAMRLLCDPALHLAEIAGRLGYTEQTSFTRAFRRWTGTTPGAWRELHAPAR